MPHALRFAFRSLRKSPLFAGVAVVSLGVALALNTTMFALVDSVLHPYVPYEEPERLYEALLGGGDVRRPQVTSAERMRILTDGLRSAQAIATYSSLATLVEAGAKVEDAQVGVVSLNFFDVLGVRPVAGRSFGLTDAEAGGRAAVISYRLWKGTYAGRPLDQIWVGVGGQRYDVVGVMPRGMHLGASDVWVPARALHGDSSGLRFQRYPIIRLKPDATESAAQAELALVAQRLTAEYGSPERGYWSKIRGIVPPPKRLDGFYKFMVTAVTVVLLIACANLGTMMLARGMARRRDTAVRIAVGASRGAIVREVLAECGVLAAAGGALGVLLTVWALFLLSTKATRYVSQFGDLTPVPSWRVFAYALAAAVVTILLAGLLPALRAAGTDPAEPMKEGSGSTTGRVRDRYSPLVMLEVALSTALLMTAALSIMGVLRLSNFQFMYDARKVLSVRLLVPRTTRAPEGSAELARRFDDIVGRVGQLPGARMAATEHPESPHGLMVFGEAGAAGERWMNLRRYRVVSPDYLRTLGIRVIHGRDFEPGDRAAAAAEGGVVIVDEDAAKRIWLDAATAVGRRIKLGDAKSNQPWLRVIGVARTTETAARNDLYLAPEPSVYLLPSLDSSHVRMLVVRGVEDQSSQSPLAVTLRRQLREIAGLTRVGGVTALTASFDERMAGNRFLALLFSAFGAFALSLCAIGLYGVLAYTVSRRMRELAVRVALGARRRDVVRLVVHDAAVTALAGIGAGAFLALAIGRGPISGSSAFEVVMALVGAEATLLLATFLASLGPLRRAARADPVEALRAT